MRRLLPVLTLACLLLLAPAARASKQMESTFQDDNQLIYATPDKVAKTLDRLKLLGVDRLRISVFWKTVAPSPTSDAKPGFDAMDPNAYPAGAWDRYDTVVRLATARGIGVNLNPTSPAPDWATGTPDRADIDDTFDPDAGDFGLFMHALGRRYDGTFTPPGATGPLPRVDFWSIWNEPNQAGWLTPQWARDPGNPGKDVETAPRIYRALVDAAYRALTETGHQQDTILIGETAPKGLKTTTGETRAIDALRFVRQLYCLDDTLQLYQGSSAQLRDCPVGDDAAAKFVDAHPGLFRITGYAHHPYELTFAPNVRPRWKDWVTIANVPTLGKLLGRIFGRFGQPLPQRAKRFPLYLTEFGYQTDPPDPTAVSPAKQAAYLNQAEYIAWRDASVKSLNQFLLVDDKPVPGVPLNSPDAWITFQSGLLFASGRRKPAYGAYEVPIFLPVRQARRGARIEVWGGVRRTPRQSVRVQFRRSGAKRWRTVKVTRTDRIRGYLDTSIRLPGRGAVRLAWTDPKRKKRYVSRVVPVGVRR